MFTRQELTYEVDGVSMTSTLLRDPAAKGPRPGVLHLSDAFGVASFSFDQGEKLAAMGYIVLVGDIAGGGKEAEQYEDAGKQANYMKVNKGALRRRVLAAMDVLAKQPGVDAKRLGAVGYCLGGYGVLEIARSGYDCAAVVSFHGILTTLEPAAPGAVKTKVLVCTGADDPVVPPADIATFQSEMDAAKSDCQLVIYTGAGHSFTKPNAHPGPGRGYHEPTARRSWAALTAHFNEAFGAA